MDSKKLKIFISAYACEPNLGSEIGVGWNWVLQMSKYFELWVLTRKSNQLGIEAWLEENPSYKNIHFVYFDLPYHFRFWKKGMRGVRLYYNIWQWCTNTLVKKIMQENNIKIFHHLTYGNSLWSVSKYGKKQFFVWGPTGGTETIASEYTKHYHLKGRILEGLRRFVVNSLKYNLGYRNRCKQANLILCKTETQKNNIPLKFRDKALLFTDVAVNIFDIKEYIKKEDSTHVTYLMVGKLDPWRGFDLAIEAIVKAFKDKKNIRLQIVGDGIDRKRLENLIQLRSATDYIEMLGKVSMERYNQLMQEADVVLNPCLKEGAVTTAFDSMAMEKPLICTDTGGYTRYFSNDYAIVIPQQLRTSMIMALTNAILKLTNPKLRTDLCSNAKIIGERFTWASRGEEIYKLITKAYNTKDK